MAGVEAKLKTPTRVSTEFSDYLVFALCNVGHVGEVERLVLHRCRGDAL